MKRISILLLAACMAVPILGCVRKTVFTDELPCNITTGYDWILDENYLHPKSTGKVNVELTYLPDPAKAGLLGAAGNTRVTVTGAEPGEAYIRLCYVRAWEWDGDAAKAEGVATYGFKVRRDGSLDFMEAEVNAPANMAYETGKQQLY